MSVDRLAFRATTHCLTGCVVGEIAGMTIGMAAGLPSLSTVVLAIALAFAAGYALTMRPLLGAGASLAAATRTALASDTLSIAVMEAIDNAFVMAVPGAMDAGLDSPIFWGSLAAGFAIAFPFAFLANRVLIARGGGAAHHGHH